MVSGSLSSPQTTAECFRAFQKAPGPLLPAVRGPGSGVKELTVERKQLLERAAGTPARPFHPSLSTAGP